MNISSATVHAVFLMQITFFLQPVSQSMGKAIFIISFIVLFMLAVRRNSEVLKWRWKSMHETGLLFLLYYAFTLLLGFFYGYAFKYTAVNIMFLLPLFIFILTPRNIDATLILTIILGYSLLSGLIACAELIAWEEIGFLHSIVVNSFNELGRSKIYSEEDGVIAFGFFSNAVANGLLLISGFVICLVRFSSRRHWYYLAGLVFFFILIYFTYTRNNYLTLLFSFILWLVLSKAKLTMFNNSVWRFSLLFYVMVMVMAVVIAITVGGGMSIENFSGESSVQSRVISWGIIISDYLLGYLTSPHLWFGFGLTQLANDFSPEKSYWAIDNSLMMVYLSSGVIGISLFLFWIKSALNLLHRTYLVADAHDQINIKIIVILLMSYFINGAMNATILSLTFLLPLLILISKYSRQEHIIKRKFYSKLKRGVCE